ncbi:MAG: energy transducer TonB [Cytophagaceae bacterium]
MKILLFLPLLLSVEISRAQDFNKINDNKRFTVTVFFTIDTLGRITEVRASPKPGIDEAFLHDAERIVMSMAPFEPEMQHGKAVMGRRRLDVNFNPENR